MRDGTDIEKEQSIIYQSTIPQLQEAFYEYCATHNGFGESVEILCNELSIDPAQLVFDEAQAWGRTRLPACDLLLLRFDQLVRDFAPLLSSAVGRPITQIRKNLAENHWYASRYQSFRQSLPLPQRLVHEIYQSRRHLLDLFYPGRIDAMIEAAIERYPERAPDGMNEYTE